MPHSELYRFLFGVVHVAPLFLIADNLRLRKLRRRRLEQDAERAVRALAGKVVIAGVGLPLPDDERWTETICEYTQTEPNGVIILRKAKLPALKLGPIIVGGKRLLGHDYIIINGEPIERESSEENRAYAASVWQHYRNRLVNRALSGGEK